MSERRCPDGGTCHHKCSGVYCYRVECCGPLSGVFPNNEWPKNTTMTFYAVVNDLIGGYDVSIFNKPASEHDSRPIVKGGRGEFTIGSFISKEWAERIAAALNRERNG